MRAPSIKKRVQKIRHHIDRKIPNHITQKLYLQWDKGGKVFVYYRVNMGLRGFAPHASHDELDPPPLFTAHYSDGWRKIVGKILLLVG